MDSILVDMLGTWLAKYNELQKDEVITIKDVVNWDVGNNVKHPQVLRDILNYRGFFYDLPPMPDGPKYMEKLIDDGLNVVVVTQAPRNSDWAIKDKRRWLREHIEGFDLASIIFAHKKELIDGDIIFDDKPSHLEKWKRARPNKVTASIQYLFNKNAPVDWMFPNKETAWKEFYEAICRHNKIFS
jgi:5'(3')-deoxyribonucleotidase